MNSMFAVFGMGGWEIMIVILVILILFGAKRIPELAKGLGTGIKEFKKAAREVTEEVQNAGETNHPPSKPGTNGQQPPSTVSQSQSSQKQES